MSILSWTEAFVKYKDSVKRQIQSINKMSDRQLTVHMKTGDLQTYFCSDLLSEEAISKEYDKVVCLNMKKNLDWLIERWDSVKDKKATFIFVNLKKSESWLVTPRVHHGITDKSALKPGLKTLFETVPEVS